MSNIRNSTVEEGGGSTGISSTEVSSTEVSSAEVSKGLSGRAQRVGVYLGVALAIFLMGFLPMWMKASANASQRDAAQRELRLSQMHGTLASAVVDARRGEYEPARQTASDFFTTLRAQIEAGAESTLSAPQRESAAALLARRDDVITLLARGDAAAAEQLSDIYVSYRKAVNGVQVK